MGIRAPALVAGVIIICCNLSEAFNHQHNSAFQYTTSPSVSSISSQLNHISHIPLQISLIQQPTKSSTALYLETKEREEVVNGDIEKLAYDDGKESNGSDPLPVNGINGVNATHASSSTHKKGSQSLTDFFERIFEENESFGALDDSDESVIQRSIDSLTAGAEENNVPDILNLTVDFANKVYQNMTENGVNGNVGGSTNIDMFASSSSAFSEDLPAEITNSITELFRQLEVALDERFVEACEEIAFYDVQGVKSEDVLPGPKRLLEEDYERMRREDEEEKKRKKKETAQQLGEMRKKSKVVDAKSSTISAEERKTYMDEIAVTSKRMKTTEILRNFSVAPVYYTLALGMRWIQKASAPPLAMLMFLRGLAYPVKWREGRTNPSSRKAAARKRLFGRREESTDGVGRTKTFGDEQIADEEFIQGWKRTGEIAAKGKRGRALATFRRSAEIWFYFSSFYIKDMWILKNYNSGRWSKERFEEERGKLGGQLTQSLLRLGPTFIKVRMVVIM